MPRTEAVNQRIRDARRDQLVEAAAQVFARKGLSAAKIADIAAAAGISHGLAYRYFVSKEEVFAAVVERAMLGASRLAEAALEQPGTPLEKLRWLTQQVIPSAQARPAYTLVVMYALTNEAVPAEVRELALRQSRIMQVVVRQLIVAGQASGQMTAGDPDQLTMLYLACIQGLASGATVLTELAPTLPDADAVLRMLTT